MAQKSNPISLRLKKTNKLWSSSWYGDYNYTTQLLQDCQVHAHMQNICQQAKIAPPVAFIDRGRQQMRTFFYFPNPGGMSPRQQRTPKMRIKRAKHFILSALLRAQENKNWFSKIFFKESAPFPFGGEATTPKAIQNAQGRGSEEQLSPVFNGMDPRGEKKEKGFPSPRKECIPLGEKGNGQEKIFTYLLLSFFTPFPQGGGGGGEKGVHKDFTFFSSTFHHLLAFTSEYKPWIYPALTKVLRQGDNLLLKKDYPRVDAPFFSGDPIGTYLEKSQAALSLKEGESAPPLPNVLLKKKGNPLFSPYMQAGFPPGKGVVAPQENPLGVFTPLQSAGIDMNSTERKDGINHITVSGAATPWKNHLEDSIYAGAHYRCKIHFLLCPSSHQNPLFLATQVVLSLQDRVPFRRLKHRLMRDISKDPKIKGVRITCSGRVAARSKKAQKAKTESIQWGQTSLNVFSDFVHFASKSALTPFGKIGVKVWICYR